MVVSSVEHLLNCYLDEDRTGRILDERERERVNRTFHLSVRNSRLTMRFSGTGDDPLRTVIFVSMIVDRNNIHVDDIPTGRL